MFTITSRITFLRKEMNLSQEELSNKIYLSRTHIGNLETGRHSLTDSTIEKFCEVFNVPEIYFKSVERNDEFDLLLKKAFEDLLYNKTEKLYELFEKKIYHLEINQEVAFKLLQAVYYFKKNDFEKANKISENFISVFVKNVNLIKDEIVLLKYYYLFCYEINFIENRLKDCYHYCKMISEITDDNYQKGRILVIQSQILFRNDFLNEALKSINETIDFIESFDKGFLLASANVALSSLLISFKFYDEALVTLKKLENINKRIENEDISSALLQHRGIIFERRKEYLKAIENYEKAYHIAKNHHNQIEFLISLIICHLNTTTNTADVLKLKIKR